MKLTAGCPMTSISICCEFCPNSLHRKCFILAIAIKHGKRCSSVCACSEIKNGLGHMKEKVPLAGAKDKSRLYPDLHALTVWNRLSFLPGLPGNTTTRSASIWSDHVFETVDEHEVRNVSSTHCLP